MAKSSTLRNIGIVVTIAFVFASGIASFVWTQADVKAVDTKIDTHTTLQEEKFSRIIADADDLELEGSKPARKNKEDIIVIKKDISTIKEDVADMRTEQREGFKEILKRLPK